MWLSIAIHALAWSWFVASGNARPGRTLVRLGFSPLWLLALVPALVNLPVLINALGADGGPRLGSAILAASNIAFFSLVALSPRRLTERGLVLGGFLIRWRRLTGFQRLGESSHRLMLLIRPWWTGRRPLRLTMTPASVDQMVAILEGHGIVAGEPRPANSG